MFPIHSSNYFFFHFFWKPSGLLSKRYRKWIGDFNADNVKESLIITACNGNKARVSVCTSIVPRQYWHSRYFSTTEYKDSNKRRISLFPGLMFHRSNFWLQVLYVLVYPRTYFFPKRSREKYDTVEEIKIWPVVYLYSRFFSPLGIIMEGKKRCKKEENSWNLKWILWSKNPSGWLNRSSSRDLEDRNRL